MMLVQYLLDADHESRSRASTQPQTSFADAAAPVELALDAGEARHRADLALAALAREENDLVGEQFLHWFLQEQREEVASMSTCSSVVRRAGDNLLLVEDFLSRNQVGDAGVDVSAPPAAAARSNPLARSDSGRRGAARHDSTVGIGDHQPAVDAVAAGSLRQRRDPGRAGDIGASLDPVRAAEFGRCRRDDEMRDRLALVQVCRGRRGDVGDRPGRLRARRCIGARARCTGRVAADIRSCLATRQDRRIRRPALLLPCPGSQPGRRVDEVAGPGRPPRRSFRAAGSGSAVMTSENRWSRNRAGSSTRQPEADHRTAVQGCDAEHRHGGVLRSRSCLDRAPDGGGRPTRQLRPIADVDAHPAEGALARNDGRQALAGRSRGELVGNDDAFPFGRELLGARRRADHHGVLRAGRPGMPAGSIASFAMPVEPSARRSARSSRCSDGEPPVILVGRPAQGEYR